MKLLLKRKKKITQLNSLELVNFFFSSIYAFRLICLVRTSAFLFWEESVMRKLMKLLEQATPTKVVMTIS